MKSEKGNVLLIVLLAIALYGLLTFALSKSDDASSFGTDVEELKAGLGQIYNYTATMKQAVQKMKTINNCGNDGIDFFLDTVTHANYQHASENPRCKLFVPKGGGMSFKILGGSALATEDSETYRFTGQQEIPDVGTNGNSELIVLVNVTQEACIQMNKKLGIVSSGSTPPDWSTVRHTQTDYFNGGNSVDGGYITGESFNTDFTGKEAGCLHDDTEDEYFYYQVLIAR